MDYRLEKTDFADLVKDAKSVAGFLLPVNFESDGMTSHKHGLAAKTVSEWRLAFLRRISSGWRCFQSRLSHRCLVEKLIVHLL